MDKKYELTDRTIDVDGHILHKIMALKDFRNVKAGNYGGFIESENNLSHSDECWVCGSAKVFGNTEIYGNALVSGKALICDNAKIFDDAWVYHDVIVSGGASIYGNARVFGKSKIRDNASIFDSAEIFDSDISGNAKVFGNSKIHGAMIATNNDIIIVDDLVSRDETVAIFRRRKDIWVSIYGFFHGTLEEFEFVVRDRYSETQYGREYLKIINNAKNQFEIKG